MERLKSRSNGRVCESGSRLLVLRHRKDACGDHLVRDASRLARHGCYAELSSAATLTGVETLLRQGKIRSDETVALIATSNGYKDMPSGVGLP